MKVSLKLILTIFLISLSTTYAICQSLEQKLDDILFQKFSVFEPGVTALVVKEGKVLYRKSIGMANVELGLEMKPDQIFKIASITKQFTAAAILKLAEEDKLTLEDSIQQYISDFPVSKKSIRIKNLLSHTSGIKNYTAIKNWEEAIKITNLSPKELISIFKDEPLAFEPGEQFSYSNLGYIVLGHIVEVVSGLSFGEYLQQSFFDPLNMNQTSYDDTKSIIANRIPGYSKRDGAYFNAEYLDMKLAHAAGGLLSSVDDLLTWNENIFNNKVIHQESLIDAHRPFKLNDGRLVPYGYGWRIGNIQGEKSIKHDGIINGFVSIAIYLPDHEVFVALFSNCDFARDIETPASKIAAIVLDKPFQVEPVSLSKETLMNYQGIYQSLKGHKKHITYQNGQLMYHDKGGQKIPLTPIAENQFYVKDNLETLVFSIEPQEEKPSFTLKTLGLPTKWERVSKEVTALESIALEDTMVERVLGKYEFKGAFTLEIIKIEDQVFGQVGNDKKEILPYEENKFFARFTDIKLIFDLATNGEVIGLSLIQGMEMQADKIE